MVMQLNNEQIKNLITSPYWQKIFKQLYNSKNSEDNNYFELIGFQYSFNPRKNYIISRNKLVFDINKAAKMYYWYKSKNNSDKSIIDSFPEYKNCFYGGKFLSKQKCNSNYGIYAYSKNGLDFCIEKLKANCKTRQACFCINNNKAMSSPDKLCTNTIHFNIKNESLIMVIQMRSSNFLTLLPYDIFNFTIFYAYVYEVLRDYYFNLKTCNIVMQINSLHFYTKDLVKAIGIKDLSYRNNLLSFSVKNIINNFENNLKNATNNDTRKI